MTGRLRTYAPLRAKSKPSVDAEVRQQVMERASERCEVVFPLSRCPRRAIEIHHVAKRSRGGKGEPDNLIAVCRSCHDRTDFPYKRGRLVIRPLGQGRFECALVTAPDKFAVRDGR